MMAELLESTLGPWTLNLVSVSDDISHTLSETTYPYKNGADVEDMGVDPEVFKFSCVIKNQDYEDNYTEIRRWFLSRFPEPVELIHPEHGTLYGYPRNASFSNDRRRKFAEFTFEFVIADIQPEIQSYADPKESNYEETVAVNEEARAAIAEEMQREGVPDVPGSDWSLMEKCGQLGDAARSYSSKVRDGLGKVLGVVETVKAPLDAISSTIDYVDSLSGTLTKAFQGCMDSLTAVFRRVDTLSKSSVSTLVADASSMMDNVSGMPSSAYAAFATIAAATVATETAAIIVDDEKKMGESIAAERVELDDAEGRLVADDKSYPIITPQDIEDSVSIARVFINRVLPVSISPERLKKMAATLSDAVLRIKMEYLTTKKINVQEETPLHKIALENGLSYKSADRLCALNGIKNPTFVKGEVLVYES